MDDKVGKTRRRKESRCVEWERGGGGGDEDLRGELTCRFLVDDGA